MTGVFRPVRMFDHQGSSDVRPVAARASSVPRRTSQCKALFFNGKNHVLQQIAYFSQVRRVCWSVAWHGIERNEVVGSGERLQHLRRMLFSSATRQGPRRRRCYWSSTPISGYGRRPCATRSPSSARRRWCAASPRTASTRRPLWKTYVDAGWTELTDPGERGRTGDRAGGAGPRHRSDAVPCDDDPVRPAGRGPVRPAAGGHRRLRRGHGATATPTAGCWTARRVTCSTAIGPTGSRS